MRPVTATAIIPIRSFTGLTRLSGVLDQGERVLLMRQMAAHTYSAVHEAVSRVLVVSNDPGVVLWCEERGCEVVPEVGGGLNGAAAVGVAAVEGGPWMVIHADLPAISADDVRAGRADDGGWVIAPSRDGGTSLIGGTGEGFPFRYGPGSFRRHLAAINGGATVLIRPGLALDLDHPWDLEALRRLGHL